MSQASKPPFRADHVGSLLRPPELREARAKAKRGELPAAALAEIEDRCDPRSGRETGGDRPRSGHRRRVPPRLVAPRLPLRLRRHRSQGLHRAQVPGRRRDSAHADGHRPDPRDPPEHGRPLRVPEVGGDEDGEVHHPVAVDGAPARRHEGDPEGDLPRPGRVLGRPRRGLPRDDRRPRRGRLHLSAARRHHLLVPRRRQDEGPLPRERRRPRGASPDLRRRDQARTRRASAGNDGDAAHLPRQLPEHLGGGEAVRGGDHRVDVLRPPPTRTSWNSTRRAPAGSTCCGCSRAGRRWCSAW